MRILGIDPGSRVTGYGLILKNGNSLSYLASGCIRINTSGAFPDRLRQIFLDLSEIIQFYQPTAGAVEQVFMKNNVSTALKLGRAQGAAICAMTALGLSVVEYSTREVKQAIVSHGGAKKEQVQYMVKALLNLSGELQSDAADALAVAICHAHCQR